MIERATARGELPVLSGVTDPLPALEGAQRGGRALEEDQLIALRAFLGAVGRLGAWLLEHEEELPANAALARGLPDLDPLARSIDAVVDERGRVRDDASELLAKLRREGEGLGRGIDKALRALVARPEIRAVLSDTNHHRRAARTVLAVRAKSRGRVPGIVYDHSQSGETVFVEPREVVELGNRRFEVLADERREVARILLGLLRTILGRSEAIGVAADRIGRLELALIAARFAEDFDARVPEVVACPPEPGELSSGEPGAGLVLRAARHPLLVEQERNGQLQGVVPIDLRLSEDFDLLILTGPNTGGKTLALKTAGLFSLLVRCGLPIPCAEGTRVPLYSGVIADIGDEQEIRQNLSTFSSHLRRIQSGVERADRTTLFLLDELGGGTDPDQGAALSEALLEHLVRRGVPTLASTHIGKLKEFAYREPRVENASVEFDTVSLEPRYRILIGTPGESAALVIARRLGLAPELIDRAEARLDQRDGELEELMAAVGDARQEAERARSRAESHLADASRTSREATAQQQELERRGELLETEAQHDLEERIRGARGRLGRARAVLAQLPAAARDAMREELDALDAELSGAVLSEKRQQFLASLSKGSFVYLPRYRKRCLIQRVDRGKQEVRVLLGNMQVRVSFDELASFEGPGE
jgi:DNA mismatch repair protein MutS2